MEVSSDVKERLGSETITSSKDVVFNTMSSLQDLRTTGEGICEQCKMIIDLTYQIEDVEMGKTVLPQLCGVYKMFYSNCQEH